MPGGKSGFTLMELVVALGLLGVGLLGLIQMTSGLLKHNAAARQRNAALYLARDRMEGVCREDYGHIAGSVEEGLHDVSGKGVFRRDVAVVENTIPACKEITVTVSFESEGRHSVTLGTIVAAP